MSSHQSVRLAIISRARMEMKITNTMGSMRTLMQSSVPPSILQISKVRQSLGYLVKFTLDRTAQNHLQEAHVFMSKALLHPELVKTHCSQALSFTEKSLETFQHANLRLFSE